MNIVLNWINNLDELLWLLVLMGSLAYAGSKILGQRERAMARRVVAAVFIAYLFYAIFKFEPETVEQAVGVVLRAALACGLSVGPTFLTFAIVGFLGDYSASVRENASRRRAVQEWHRQIETKKRSVVAPPVVPPPVVVTEPTIEEQEAAIASDYQRECTLINNMQCAEDEKGSRLRYADKKRLKRLAKILK